MVTIFATNNCSSLWSLILQPIVAVASGCSFFNQKLLGPLVILFATNSCSYFWLLILQPRVAQNRMNEEIKDAEGESVRLIEPLLIIGNLDYVHSVKAGIFVQDWENSSQPRESLWKVDSLIYFALDQLDLGFSCLSIVCLTWLPAICLITDLQSMEV